MRINPILLIRRLKYTFSSFELCDEIISRFFKYAQISMLR